MPKKPHGKPNSKPVGKPSPNTPGGGVNSSVDGIKVSPPPIKRTN
ncbi:hypothetical protein ACE38V_01125 [Cytobacillus sp. Hz8]